MILLLQDPGRWEEELELTETCFEDTAEPSLSFSNQEGQEVGIRQGMSVEAE